MSIFTKLTYLLNNIQKTKLLLILLPFGVALLAQLFFYNVYDVFNKCYLTKPFKTFFNQFDPGLSLDIGIILYFLAFTFIFHLFKDKKLLKKRSFKFSNNNKGPINIKKILLLSTGLLIIELILFVSLGINNQYSIILFILWLFSIASLIGIGIIIDKQPPRLNSFKMTKKELFFNGCAIVFILAFGITALEIIPNIMVAYGDGVYITNTAYLTLKNFSTINIFSNSDFCNIPNLGMLLKSIFFPFLQDNFLAGRHTSIIAASLTVIPCYLLTRNMFNHFIAIITIMTLFTNYVYLLFVKIAIFPTYVILFFILSLLCFISSLKSKNYTFIILSGLIAGLATYTWGGGIVIFASIGLCLLYLLITNRKEWSSIIKIGLLFTISFMIMILPLFCNSLKYKNNGCFDRAVSDKTILRGALIDAYKKKYNTNSLLHIIQERFIEGIKVFSLESAEKGAPYIDITQSIFLFFSIIFFFLFRKKNLYLTLIMITFFSVIFFGGVLSSGYKIKRISLAMPFICILSSIAIFMYAQKIKDCFKSKKIQKIIFGLVIFCCISLIMINNLTNTFLSIMKESMPTYHYMVYLYIKNLSKNNEVYVIDFTETPKNIYNDTTVDNVILLKYLIGERAVFKPGELVYSSIKFDSNTNTLITKTPLKKGKICFIYPKKYDYLITNYLIKRFGLITYIHPDLRWGIPYSVAILENNNE